MNKEVKTTLTVADIGSEKIKVLVADSLGDGALSLCGVGESQAKGVREGLVVDIEKAAVALGNALKEAEIMSKRTIDKVIIAVSGENVKGAVAKGSSVINDSMVTVSNVNEVKKMARTEVPDKNDLRILETLERGYEIDGQKRIIRPEGMTGRRLSGEIYLLSASRNALANMEKCVSQAGVGIEGEFIFSPLAAAESILSEDEKDIGVCLVDIGSSISDLVIYSHGTVHDACVFNIAGDDITRDIAQMHHVSLEAAEDAKRKIGVISVGDEKLVDLDNDNGFAAKAADDEQRYVSLGDASGFGMQKIGRSVVQDTIASRVDEIFEKIQEHTDQFSREERYSGRLSAGLVLVGGSALLPGIVERAKSRFAMRVRMGVPRYRGEKHEIIANPRFAVGAGLLAKAAILHEEIVTRADESMWLQLKKKLKNIFQDDTDSVDEN